MQLTKDELDRIVREATLKAIYEAQKLNIKVSEQVKPHIKKRAVWASVLLVICVFLELFVPQESFYFKIGIFLSAILNIFGYRSDYKFNRLGKKETNFLDKVPNFWTSKRIKDE